MQTASYDSADFCLNTSQQVSLELVSSGELGLQQHGGEPGAATDSDAEVQEVSRGTQTVLQSDLSVLMLVRVGGRHAVVRGNSISWLQVCDKNTAELYKKCLEAQSITSAAADQVERKIRLVCTDGAGSIAKAERHIQEERDDKGWNFMHLTCRVHLVSGIHTRLFGLMPSDISGLVSLSLALSPVGQMGRCRHAVRKTLADKVYLVAAATLSDEARAFKQVVVSTFVGDRFDKVPLRMVLERCCPGDWRQPGWPVVANKGESRREVLKMMYKVLVQRYSAMPQPSSRGIVGPGARRPFRTSDCP